MISPEAAEKGFHQREQETMHFKYSANMSEERGGGGGGTHSCTEKAYYFSGTKKNSCVFYWHIHGGS